MMQTAGQGGQQMAAQPQKITLSDAIRNVSILQELLILLPDDVTQIEAANVPLQYTANMDTNFEDRNAFVTGVARYIEEATIHAQFNELLEESKQFAVMFYTWRSCSRALPEIKSNEQPNRFEIYEKTVKILQPQVSQLVKFMYFQRRAVDRFIEEVKRLCHARERRAADACFVSEAFLLTLGKMLNMFSVLDELKNMKASVKNDYAVYRRYAQSLRIFADNQTLNESQNLVMFLGKQNQIREHLKTQLSGIPNYEEVLCDVVQTAVEMFEERRYILPSEKHMLVKIIGFALFLVDSEGRPDERGSSINKLDKKGALNLSKIDRILKQCEVVVLYGDMSIVPFAYVKRTPNYDSSKWPECTSSKPSGQCCLLENLPRIRSQHTKYISELARVNNELNTIERDAPPSDEENRALYDLALRGLQLLSEWNTIVVDLYSYKLSHMTDRHANPECPQQAEDYERATRYNYSAAEKSALVELIAMIKGLQVLLVRLEHTLNESVKRHVYTELQRFVQIGLREPLRKSIKNKKEIVRTILTSIRHTCADWPKGIEPSVDEIMQKVDSSSSSKSSAAANANNLQLNRRSIGPSSTQLYMVRTMAESLIDKSGGKRTLRKDVDVSGLSAIDAFLRDSFFWSYVLDFGSMLRECCDLSPLWYREFFLEMTMGARIQFPIEMSLPWILTDHVLASRDASLMEYVLYPLDLYNDSAYYALTQFRKQFLYDEVEAELSLVFDQLLFKLSEQVFQYTKQLAAHMLLDRVFASECTRLGITIKPPPGNRYATLLRQRHVQLLGRSIDLNALVAQRCNALLRRSLDAAIRRFEANDLQGVVELEALLECNRLTHRLLSEHLTLVDFDQLLHEENNSVTVPYGRITLHLFWMLNADFVTNFCFNAATNRFVKTVALFQQDEQQALRKEAAERATDAPHYLFGNKATNACFAQIFSLFSNFLGAPHFRAIIRLLGYDGIAVIIDEILKVLKNLLQTSIAQYVRNLVQSLPRTLKMPRYEYGSPGILQFYQAQLKHILSSSDLRTEVFQAFRECGNIVLFCLLLEQALVVEEASDLKQAAAFQNVIPKPFVALPAGREQDPNAIREREAEIRAQTKRLEARFAALNVHAVVSKLGTQKQAEIVQEADLLTRERLCCGLSIFDVVLQRIRSFLFDETSESSAVWQPPANAPPPLNGVTYIDDSVDFARCWSVVQFAYCFPLRDNEYSTELLFGDSLNWAGCTLIAVLDQRARFEALDFAYHLLKVNRVDSRDELCQGVQLRRMADRIRRFQILNNEIFSVLNKYLRAAQESGESASQTQIVHVKCFQPPTRRPTSAQPTPQIAPLFAGGPQTNNSAIMTLQPPNAQS